MKSAACLSRVRATFAGSFVGDRRRTAGASPPPCPSGPCQRAISEAEPKQDADDAAQVQTVVEAAHRCAVVARVPAIGLNDGLSFHGGAPREADDASSNYDEHCNEHAYRGERVVSPAQVRLRPLSGGGRAIDRSSSVEASVALETGDHRFELEASSVAQAN